MSHLVLKHEHLFQTTDTHGAAGYHPIVREVAECDTIATDLARYCPHCKRNTSQRILLPIIRGSAEGNGYETWTPALRKRIIDVLGGIDVYENTYSPHCLPDHKFSEIRWDENTKAENPADMTDDEIRRKFQLMTNQRNQQKREVCRTCFQTGKRGYPFLGRNYRWE